MGTLDILQKSGGKKTVRIQRIHLEEDAGKLLHAVGSRALDYSLVDLNRTGVPLMEIVSEPDIRSPEEASDYLDTLRTLLRYVGASECDMEKGSMRCDANVSIRPVGQTTLGTRAEVKNMNSFAVCATRWPTKSPVRSRWWKAGGGWCRKPGCGTKTKAPPIPCGPRKRPTITVISPTRIWCPWNCRPIGWKPCGDRYRNCRKPGVPATSGFGPVPYDAAVLTAEKTLADFFATALNRFEELARRDAAKPLTNWLTTELLGRLNAQRKTLGRVSGFVGPLADLVKLILKGVINSKAAKVVFDHMFTEGGDPESDRQSQRARSSGRRGGNRPLGGRGGGRQSQNCRRHSGRKGRGGGSLVGQVMKKSGGRANPQTVQRLLKKKLGLP
jgi:aspartyl-tRNA(Asn)/glutamyl-tRNA(Gln) amidotransferase subunit B